MSSFEKIKSPLEKALRAIHKDNNKLKYAGGGLGITARRIANAIGNHLFDDYPELFSITKNEGQCIRDYFNMACNDYQFVIDFYQNFPDLLDVEEPAYMKMVNEVRQEQGLEAISFDFWAGTYPDALHR